MIETRKYAELIISMSTDYLTNKINETHYKNTLSLAIKQLFIADVSNSVAIKPPHFKHKNMDKKAEIAKELKNIGYSIREIMRIMNYKSPRSVQVLLKK